jgi:hypothetical protein
VPLVHAFAIERVSLHETARPACGNFTSVHNRTAAGSAAPSCFRSMTTPYVKAAVAALWIITAGAFGTLAPVTTPSGWFMLAALAITPPLIFTQYWKRPAQTMSESMQKAIR